MHYCLILVLLYQFLYKVAVALPYTPWYPGISESLLNLGSGETVEESVVGIRKLDERDSEELEIDARRYDDHKDKTQPCSIVLISSSNQIPAMQTLLRKYRYDSRGVLIPSSVRYYMKTKTGTKRSSSFQLVPLNDASFTPLGGFVRYYKEVPPIPQIL